MARVQRQAVGNNGIHIKVLVIHRSRKYVLFLTHLVSRWPPIFFRNLITGMSVSGVTVRPHSATRGSNDGQEAIEI